MATLSQEEFLRRYPTGSYEGYVAGEQAAARFYNRPSEEVSRDLAVQHEEHRDLGWSTD